MPATFPTLALVGSALALLSGPLAVPAQATVEPLRVAGTATSDGSGGAFTYDGSQLPVGARLRVAVTYPENGTTVVTLHVKGALPQREYGAHAHVAACGAVSSAAGGHFQFVPYPVGGSPTDPAYANPSNEIWLDLVTDGEGNGVAQTTVPWQPSERRPMSVVIHAAHTSPDPGTAGTAGPRLGCLTVAF
jgi:Cu-Zn family superoxide dismutase